MDSTMIESNIKKAGRLALAFDVLHQAVKVIPDFKHTEALKEVSKPNFKTSMLYRVGSEKLNPNLDYLLNLGAEALEIAKKMPEIYARKEIKILERFLDEQAVTNKKTKMYLDGGYSSVELWQKANSKNIDLMFTDMTGTKYML